MIHRRCLHSPIAISSPVPPCGELPYTTVYNSEVMYIMKCLKKAHQGPCPSPYPTLLSPFFPPHSSVVLLLPGAGGRAGRGSASPRRHGVSTRRRLDALSRILRDNLNWLVVVVVVASGSCWR
ncbi:Hypothetical protein NTJ_04437 [Nesidiocoris tenuis]|uniref:Uncharacterized protein n=1 Tax=Nesidiocoris tenuis TaxID=355587 RepID=A0ABN7AHB6_9HEMI|nr:Hypothetical protein NTJ_04437 [Nesidiocoris tenuis]